MDDRCSLDYDVIVIGAGPAGSITAATVAAAGYHVLVLEKNTSCKSPCAGYISHTINLEVPDDSIIQSKITKMRTYFPDLSFHDCQLKGFVVDRPSFDTGFTLKAKESGADIKWNSPLVDMIPGGVKFRGGEASGKVIVGADSVFSKTASLLGIERQKVAVCAQYHIKDIMPLSQTCEIFFNTDYAPGGYAWVYPTGEDSAKVGIGLTGTGLKSPHQYLDAFIRESYVASRLAGKKTEYITGALPIGGLRKEFLFGNILLVGDSAGMSHPITGAGINNALLAGETAGTTIVNALDNDDLTNLAQYKAKINRLLGKTLTKALEKRKLMDTCYTNEMLQEHLPELWVTFKQYWL